MPGMQYLEDNIKGLGEAGLDFLDYWQGRGGLRGAVRTVDRMLRDPKHPFLNIDSIANTIHDGSDNYAATVRILNYEGARQNYEESGPNTWIKREYWRWNADGSLATNADGTGGLRSRIIRSSWRRKVTSVPLVALLTAFAAVAAAAFAYGQIKVADQQKLVSEQQQLQALVVDIEQEPAALNQAEAGLSGNALSTVETEYQNELTSYAQSAQLIINSLSSQDVPGFEYVQVGKALDMTGDNVDAITYFQRAANGKNGTPDVVAAALRNEAAVRYGLHEPTLGHQEMMAAVQAFFHNYPDVATSDADNNIAQSYLDDAYQQLLIGGCVTAQADINNADHAVPPALEVVLITDLVKSDNMLYQKKCSG
jgi:hypothetical protein